MAALPPPIYMQHSLILSIPLLRVCTPHTSNQVQRIVSQKIHRAVSESAPFTQEEHEFRFEQGGIISQFDLAFEVEEGAVAGCARLLLLPAFFNSTSPIFDVESQKHAAPNYIHNFPFRLKMKVSIRLESPLFSTEGNLFARLFCIVGIGLSSSIALLSEFTKCGVYCDM